MALQIRSDVKELSSVERQLSIVVPGDQVAKELDKAYQQLNGQVRIKGFRPGKGPRDVREQDDKADTEQKVLERVVNNSFRVAITNHAISPVANPQIEAPAQLVPGMDFAYSAKVEVKPVIDLKAMTGLKLKKTTYTVSDADVEKELQLLCEV